MHQIAANIGSERINLGEVIVRNIGDTHEVGTLMKKSTVLALASK